MEEGTSLTDKVSESSKDNFELFPRLYTAVLLLTHDNW